jgi:ABC-type transporter Mla subunit MlaD
MSQEEKKYKRVGIFAIATILIFILGYQFVSKKGIFDNSMKLYSLANDVSGISTETPILINGFEIGKVSDLNLANGKVLLEFSIDKEIKLSKKSKFISTASGIFGDRQINVENTSNGKEIYMDGDTIATEFITKPISGIVDSTLMKEIEPTLKEFSKTIGKALQDYGESDEEANTNKEEKKEN